LYRIRVRTLDGTFLTFRVDSYSIVDGDFVEFTDTVKGEKMRFHASHCEIKGGPK
jgi:hypothetical protein